MIDQTSINRANRPRRDRRDLWDKTWKDKTGRYTLWQTPNVWLMGWVVFTVLSLLFNGTVSDVFFWLASAGLLTWSFLEITRGVNYFRRALGLLVLYFTIMTIIKGL